MSARTDATDAQVVTTAVVAVPITLGFLADVIEVARFGAIDYWTDTERAHPDQGTLTVTVQRDLRDAIPADPAGLRRTEPTPGTFRIDPAAWSDAFTRIAMGRVRVRSDIVTAIRTALFEGDAGEVDAECADVLVQVAAWGSIVFG